MKKKLIAVIAIVVVLAAVAVLVWPVGLLLKKDEAKKITIMATSTPHEIILEYIKDDLKALGYDLEIIEVTDYYVGNPATAAKEVNCNYFQHIPFLNDYNASVSADEQLVAAIGVHCEPYGIYPGTKKALSEIAAGDKIAVTNDPSNETRALLLLADAGLITLPEGADYTANLRPEDIVETNGIEIVEINAEMIPAMLGDVAFAVINGNYVLDAGMTVKDDALFTEADGLTGAVYTNYVVCRPEDAESDWMNALRTALCSEKVREFILNNEAFAGGVIPTF